MKINKFVSSSVTEKKRLGAFYTPQELSDLMVSWAVTKRTDTVLEPSFGGCGFLTSCVNRYKELGGSINILPLYGCDIDPNAFHYLANTVGSFVDLTRFAHADFLTLKAPEAWPEFFDVIIGNPPYIPYQQIHKRSREHAISQIKDLGFNIDLRSSLWAYFVALSLKYLAPEGKIAWVLPGSFLQSNYSRSLREYLSSKFAHIAAFQINERLFLYEGTDETTVVLLGSGYTGAEELQGCNDIPLIYCSTYSDLIDKMSEWQSKGKAASSCASPILGYLSQETQKAYRLLINQEKCFDFGEFASVKIGLVTGANKFFVLNEENAVTNKLQPSHLIPILAKFSSVKSLSFSKTDHKHDLKNGNKCLLVSSNQKKIRSKKLEAYLQTFPKEEREKNSTFEKRQLWHSIQDKKIPDAFFPVMHHTGPKIALNTAKINCTNSIHRVYFKKGISNSKRKLIAISLLSSFSQLSAEIEGRKYGSGVLKHEPREAEKIKVIIPDNVCAKEISKEYSEINKLLKRGYIEEARAVADQFIFTNLGLRQHESFIRSLSVGLTKLRKQRYADRKKKS